MIFFLWFESFIWFHQQKQPTMSEQKNKQLKIIFLSSEGAGHINACVGLAQELAKCGHEIYFFNKPSNIGQFEKLGFKEIILHENAVVDDTDDAKKQVENKDVDQGKLRETIIKSNLLADLSPYDQLDVFDRHKNKNFFGFSMINDIRKVHEQIRQSLSEQKPDLVIVDYILIPPCIAYGQIPWAYLCSHNPLHLFNSQLLPPITSGLPTDNRSGWADFYDKFRKTYQSSLQYCQNELNKHYQCPEVNKNQFLFLSPHFNIYGYPEQLDYTDIITLPENVVRLDGFCRQQSITTDDNDNKTFELPEKIKTQLSDTVKLIYFSLGTFGSTNVTLMQKILNELSGCPHQIIVSTGQSHQQLSLSENMYGQSYLPQMSILPLVDLVITHGGNNTVTETMSYGKPMIVMPLFADQHDNAQRIMEKGFGYRINPHRFESNQLIQLIQQILLDKIMIERCTNAGDLIRKSNSKWKACTKIEKLLNNKKE
mgnify:CR=1 FL=1